MAEFRSLIDSPEIDEHERYEPPLRDENAFDEKPRKLDSDYYCLGRGIWRQGPNTGKHKYCYRRAGAGTNHLGYGRCSIHGGKAPAVENRYNELLNPTIHEKTAKFLQDPDPLNLRAELAAARALFEDFLERYEDFQEALIAWYATFQNDRRGLHDHPMYHARAIYWAIDKANREGSIDKLDMNLLHEYLERGLEEARTEWSLDVKEGQPAKPLNLYLEKPQKILDISSAYKILKLITDIVDKILKHESEAFLSVFAWQALMERYGEVVSKQLDALRRRLGLREENAKELEKVKSDIAVAWEKLPVLESSLPRLNAESERRR